MINSLKELRRYNRVSKGKPGRALEPSSFPCDFPINELSRLVDSVPTLEGGHLQAGLEIRVIEFCPSDSNYLIEMPNGKEYFVNSRFVESRWKLEEKKAEAEAENARIIAAAKAEAAAEAQAFTEWCNS